MRVGEDWVDMSECGPMGRGRATQYIGILHQEFSLYPFDTILRNLTVCIGINLPAELAKMKAIQVLTGVGFTRQDVDRVPLCISRNAQRGRETKGGARTGDDPRTKIDHPGRTYRDHGPHHEGIGG